MHLQQQQQQQSAVFVAKWNGYCMPAGAVSGSGGDASPLGLELRMPEDDGGAVSGSGMPEDDGGAVAGSGRHRRPTEGGRGGGAPAGPARCNASTAHA